LDRSYWPNLYRKNGQGGKSVNWIWISLAAYMAVLILTTFFSVDIAKSFFGSIGFMNGLLTLLHFFLLFMVFSQAFLDRKFWILFFRLNMSVGIFISAYALVQKIGGAAAPMATFGNQAYLSGYLVFIIFQALTLFWWDNKNNWKILHSVAGAASLLAIFLATDIRGSKLGVAAGLLAIILLYGLANEKEKIRKSFRWLIVLGLAVGVSVCVYAIKSGKIYSAFERSYTVKTRLVAWEAGLRGFGDKFLTGYGLENYTVPFEKYFQPTYYNQGRGSSTEFGADSPHNKIIEVAVSNGVFGLFAYLGIFVAVYQLIYARYQASHQKIFLGLAGLFGAYLAHLLFIFDTVVTLLLFFPSVAFLIFISYADGTGPAEKEEKVGIAFGKMVSIAGVVAIIFCTSVFYFVWKPAKAVWYANQAINSAKAGKYAETSDNLDSLHRENVYSVEESAILEIGKITQINFFDKIDFTQDDKKYFEKIIGLAEYNLQRNPDNLHYFIELASLYDRAGRYDQNYYAKNIELLERDLQRGTKRMEAYMMLADAYGATGNRTRAEELGLAGVALDPTYGYGYFLLGNIYFYKLGDAARANENFEKAFEYGYKNVNSLKSYADVNVKTDNLPKAIAAFEDLIKLNPKDPQQYANLVMLYYNNKDYQKARDMAEKTKKKFPGTQARIDAFLKIIPK
ncbi:MAG: O-antigen ligase family protein, partial [Candidatus Moranbacteria bacterium]|nr:O-antigen ligase family protein [Candidatus Moranbacteria bacterium]